MTTQRRSANAPPGAWLLVWIGGAAGLLLGLAIGVTGLLVSYFELTTPATPNAGETSLIFLPFAAIAGGAIGTAAGLSAAVLGLAGAAAVRLARVPAVLGIGLGSAVGGAAVSGLLLYLFLGDPSGAITYATLTGVVSGVGLALLSVCKRPGRGKRSIRQRGSLPA